MMNVAYRRINACALTKLSVPQPYEMRRSNSESRTRAELRSRDCEQAMLFATKPELRVS